MSNENMAVVKELTVEAVDDNLTAVIEFVDQQIEGYHCSEVVQMTIEVAVEELFLNIAHYAYDPDTSPVRYQGVLKLGLAGGAAPITINVDLNQ